MDKNFYNMTSRQWTGLIILLSVVAAAYLFDQLGKHTQQRHFVIQFARGLEMETGDTGVIDMIAAYMHENSDYQATVRGHTEVRGDSEVNHALSEKRADLIKSALLEKGVAQDRISTFGLGGESPLERLPDEGDRSYTRRLRRVEITLKCEV